MLVEVPEGTKIEWYVKEGDFAGWNVYATSNLPNFAPRLAAWFVTKDLADEFVNLKQSPTNGDKT